MLALGTFFGVLWVLALGEEFFFRGLLQQWIGQWLKSEWMGLALASLLFGAGASVVPRFPQLADGGHGRRRRRVLRAGVPASPQHSRVHGDPRPDRHGLEAVLFLIATVKVFPVGHVCDLPATSATGAEKPSNRFLRSRLCYRFRAATEGSGWTGDPTPHVQNIARRWWGGSLGGSRACRAKIAASHPVGCTARCWRTPGSTARTADYSGSGNWSAKPCWSGSSD